MEAFLLIKGVETEIPGVETLETITTRITATRAASRATIHNLAPFDAIINLITSSLLSSANNRRIALYLRLPPARFQVFSKF